jgi:hypothetical protein
LIVWRQGKVSDQSKDSWETLFLKTINTQNLPCLNQLFTYVFELCTVENKVVAFHPEPHSILLTIVENLTGIEEDYEIKSISKLLNCQSVEHYQFDNYEELHKWIEEKPYTFEGCVVKNGKIRIKIKNSKYVAMHRLKGNGNLTLDKYAIPIILDGEVDEVLCIYPEYEQVLRNCEEKVNSAIKEVESLWEEVKNVENQKEFALIVIKCKWNSVLFTKKKFKNKKIIDIFKENISILEKMFKN